MHELVRHSIEGFRLIDTGDYSWNVVVPTVSYHFYDVYEHFLNVSAISKSFLAPREDMLSDLF
jgi:hypothetical protein